jgi:hypothetical protein
MLIERSCVVTDSEALHTALKLLKRLYGLMHLFRSFKNGRKRIARERSAGWISPYRAQSLLRALQAINEPLGIDQ